MDKKTGKPLDIIENIMLDRIIIEAIPPKDITTETGFRIPREAQEKSVNLPKFGYIVAAGPGDPAKGEMKVKVGDKVCYAFYSGIPLTVGDKNYLIMREFDVLFTLK